MIESFKHESVELLQRMIAVPSVSREETAVADLLLEQLTRWGLKVNRSGNNVWVNPEDCSNDKPVVLLNSHIDTVKPVGYTREPFTATVEDGRLYGLGSNDAGGPLVSLLATFRYLLTKEQPCHFIFLASAEEEVSGKNGIESVLPMLGKIDLTVVGEPTQMRMAVAEKGLMVLDCYAHGKAGHAARNEGVNAIYKALPDIDFFRNHCFDRVSQFLGSVKTSVTQIDAGSQHNVVPDTCHFVVDVRVNDLYRNEELLKEIKNNVTCEVKERSTRLNSSSIAMDHPLVQRGLKLGLEAFGSPTLSDQALISGESLKIGPGDSGRSHTSDEFIYLREIDEGIDTYIKLLDNLVL